MESKTLKLFTMAGGEEDGHTAAAAAVVVARNHASASMEEDELKLSLSLPAVGDRSSRKIELKSSFVNDDLNLNAQICVERVEYGSIEDPKVKREVQAWRRQEARKKREEKRKARSGGNEDRVLFERQVFEAREMDRERKEMENESEACEKARKGCNNRVDFTFSKLNLPPTSFLGGGAPVSNGGCALPCWVNTNSDVVQPLSGGGFRPYQSLSNCSRGSSSGISDYQSTSGQGASSSDGGSYSSHSRAELLHQNGAGSSNSQPQAHCSEPEPQLNGFTSTLLQAQAEGKSSCQVDSTETPKKVSIYTETTNIARPTPPQEPLSLGMHACRDKKPLSDPGTPSHQPTKVEMAKPPKPPVGGNESVLLSQMPFVSATGNGPNGKTINGFLYRYTKTEVCIVCVCHGTSFSPAGFVEHAGGVDVEHPLKHIRVVPFTIT